MVSNPRQDVSRSESIDGAERKLRLILLFASFVLIIYLSLFPLTGWHDPGVPFWSFLFSWPRTVSRSDIATNLLAYAVPGCLYCWWRGGAHRLHSVIQATLGGALLSFTMESLQTYLPVREASTVDLLANTVGALTGAMLAKLVEIGPVSDKLRSVRREWFFPGRTVDVGLVALGLWVLSQWSPLVPLMDVGAIWRALSPAWQTLHNLARFQPIQAAAYAFNITGLGLLFSLLVRPARPFFLPFVASATGVLLLKANFYSRQLSFEALIGLAAALLVLPIIARSRVRSVAACLSLVVGFVLTELRSANGATHAFNWIPFLGEFTNTLNGFTEILETTWPFVALAALANLRLSTRFSSAELGATLLLPLVFGLELIQRRVPGRYGDVTTVILALAAWLMASWWCKIEKPGSMR